MLPLILKSKAALVLITAAVAGAGTIAGVYVVNHHDATVASAAQDVPLPSAPPGQAPASVEPNNAPLFQTGAPSAPVSYAQYAPPQALPSATPAPNYNVYPQPVQLGFSSEQLNQLLGPIALYPDPLIAEILPASTYPDQLAAAALWLRYNPTPNDYAIEAQPWEPSIRALTHSPSVLIWMYNNPDWTRTLGTAVTYQQADVMASIQNLRAMAYAAGSLTSTPQQIVIYQDRYICIEPATPEVIYVPVYDWRTCYVRRYEPTFFIGAHIGTWLDFDCNWNDRFIVLGARWDRGWDHRWDHDRDARPVLVRDARDGDRRDGTRTTINNTTVINKTVQVGGTPWQRNDARPAPTLPASVRPARQPDAGQRPATPDRPRTPDRPPDQRTLTPTPPTTPSTPVTPATPDGRRGRDGRGAVPATPATPGGRGATPATPAVPPTPVVPPSRGADRGPPPDRGSDGNPGRGNRGDGRGNPDDTRGRGRGADI